MLSAALDDKWHVLLPWCSYAGVSNPPLSVSKILQGFTDRLFYPAIDFLKDRNQLLYPIKSRL